MQVQNILKKLAVRSRALPDPKSPARVITLHHKRTARGCRGCGRIPKAAKLAIFGQKIQYLGKIYSYIHVQER